MSRREIPPVSISFPARMKRGTASRVNESIPVNIFWGTRMNGSPPVYMSPASEASPKANEIGVLRMTNTANAMNKGAAIFQPSPSPCLPKMIAHVSETVLMSIRTALTGIAAYGTPIGMAKRRRDLGEVDDGQLRALNNHKAHQSTNAQVDADGYAPLHRGR